MSTQCPTCNQSITGDLAYFAQSTLTPPDGDDVAALYEDAHKVLSMLGALVEAVPHAIAHRAEGGPGSLDRDWIMWLSWLGEELTKEAERRLQRIQNAGWLWQEKVEELGKEATAPAEAKGGK